MNRPLVVIPTYNEYDNLEPIVRRLHDVVGRADVLIVDDGSPDGTGELADQLARADRRVHVLHRAAKSGLGGAYLAGFDWALRRDYDAVVEMDADGSHAPEELPRLLAKLDQADLVLGSRWVPGGVVEDWPFSRKLLSRAGNSYARLALGLGLKDATGGYRAFRPQALLGLDLDSVQSQGYCFQIDLAWRAVRAGLTVVEVPITFRERQLGESKMDSAVVFEAFSRVTRWGWQHRRGQLTGVARFRRPETGITRDQQQHDRAA